MKLRPHQVEPAKRLLDLAREGRAAVDLSDTGVGKTFIATYVASQLRVPTLAVVPKISITQWHEAAAHFDDTISAVGYEQLRTGRTEWGWWDNTPPPGFRNEQYFRCQTCQLVVDLNNFRPCYCHPKGVHCVETKKKAWRYGKFNFHPGIKFLVFDEVHRCAATDSLNADMLIAAKRQGVMTLGLSATAACGPLQMRALGYLLDLHTLKVDKQGNGLDFYQWSRRYGCGKIPGLKGWHWLAGREKQREIMAEINRTIIPSRGVRVRTVDIPGFPERQITADLFDIDNPAILEGLYQEMQSALRALEARQSNDVAADHPLTKLLRIRQKIELLKVPLAVELARDYLAKGCSVGIFVNFAQTMAEVRAKLKCDCFIDGTPAGQKFRGKNILEFSSNKERLIVVNSEAGGVSVSLHDKEGGHPRMGLVMPPNSARTFKQLAGRFHREGAKSPCHYKVMLAAGTEEVKMYRKLKGKLNNLDALNDGDLTPFE